jgi:hypothetical protein
MNEKNQESRKRQTQNVLKELRWIRDELITIGSDINSFVSNGIKIMSDREKQIEQIEKEKSDTARWRKDQEWKIDETFDYVYEINFLSGEEFDLKIKTIHGNLGTATHKFKINNRSFKLDIEARGWGKLAGKMRIRIA